MRKLAFLLAAMVAAPVCAAVSDDFIAGYATRLVEEAGGDAPAELRVRDGVVTVVTHGVGEIERQQLIKSLSASPGVKSVEVVEKEVLAKPQAADTPTPPPSPPLAASQGNADQSAAQSAPYATADTDGGTVVTPTADRPGFVLDRSKLFAPLLADPRWPHFYASYLHYTVPGGDTNARDAGSVGFGDTIAFYRDSFSDGQRYELGLQAAVFALFDLGAPSNDLVNADYFVGPYAAYRNGNFSVLGRVYHISSHLGDEFLLRNRVDRVNLSFETVDAVASYEFPAGFRAYGGASYIFHREPDDLRPFGVQYGIEYRSPHTFAGGLIRPVAAADFQHREESDYSLDLSLRAGLQFEDPTRFSQRAQVLLEYYQGQSPNGQFYDNRIEYFGVGLHLYF